MTVYKDEQGKNWYFVVRHKDDNGNWKQAKRRGFKKRKDAQIAEREFVDSLNVDNDLSMTFEQLVVKFYEYSVDRKKARTIANEKHLINTVILPYFANKNIHEITPKQIDEFYRSIVVKYANATMKNIRRHLSAVFNYGIKFHKLTRNVVLVVDLPKKEEEKKLKYWTLEQFIKFESYLKKTQHIALFNVLFWSGMRKGEALGLRIGDINTHNNHINVIRSWNGENITTVKNTSSERSIGVPQHVIDILQEQINELNNKYSDLKDDDFLFPGRYISTPMSPAGVNRTLKRVSDLANLPNIRVHYFRHSHASMLINEGVSLYIVSRHLGHSDIQTTANIYGHLYPNTENEIIDILDSKFNKFNQNE